AGVALVVLGRRLRLWCPALAGLLIAGYFLFTYVRLWGLRPWELAGWATLGVIGLVVLAGLNLLFSGHWWRPLGWALTALLALTLGGFVGAAQAGGVSVVRT